MQVPGHEQATWSSGRHWCWVVHVKAEGPPMTTVGGGRGKIPSQFSCYPVKEKSAHETGKRRDDKRQAAQPDGAPLQARKQKRCRAWDAGVRTAGGRAVATTQVRRAACACSASPRPRLPPEQSPGAEDRGRCEGQTFRRTTGEGEEPKGGGWGEAGPAPWDGRTGAP